MKKFFVVFLIFASSLFLNAQKMEVGNNLLSVGIGPAAGYWGTYSGGTPALRIAFDHGFRKAGPGTLSFGGGLGFFNKYYKNYYWYAGNTYSYKWSYTYFAPVFRLGYYYNLSEADLDALNVYGGLGIGMLFWNVKETYSGPKDGYIPYSGGSSEFLFNLYFGANYFISSKTALYLEFGYDITYVTIGATFKLN